MPGATLTTARPRAATRRTTTAASSSCDVEGPAARRSAGRVGERDPERRTRPRGRVGDGDRAGEPQRGEVGLGDGDAHRVQVDAGDGEPGLGEGHQVAADPAARGRSPSRPPRRPPGPPGGSATRCRVACSRASGVKYIRSARSPNFATARTRSSHLGQRRRRAVRVRLAPGAAPWPRRPGRRRGRRTPRPPASSSCWPCRGQQPAEGLEVHARIIPAARAGPREVRPVAKSWGHERRRAGTR